MAAVGVAALGSASIFAIAGHGAPAGSSPLDPIYEAIPGASATLEPGGSIIDVTVPASIGVPPDSAGRTAADPSNLYKITAADTSWRVAVATDLISTRSTDVVGYTFQGLAEPPPGTDELARKDAANDSHGMVRDAPDLAFSLDIPSLGKVTLEQAEAQAASNVAQFERVATGVKVEGVAVTPVWLDRKSNVFALRIQVHVADATTLKRYLGDLISGPATGLIGDEKTLIGGLAINVTDDAGRSSGWWQTAHGSIGIGILGPALSDTVPGPIQGTYQNLTGGPGTINSVPGYTPTQPSGMSQGTTKAKPKARSTKLELVPGRSIGKAKIGDTLHQVTTALGAGKRAGRSSRVYDQAGVRIKVDFVAGRVFSVETDSAPLLLDGTPLSMGYAYFSNHTKWSHATCQGTINELFHFTKRTHAETTISWGPDGRLTNVMIQTSSAPLGSGCGAS